MENNIQVDYQALLALAHIFEDEAERYRELISRQEREVDLLRRGAWQGDAALTFFNEMDQLVTPAVNRLYNALLDGNDAIQRIGDIFSEAEEEAANPFRRAEAPPGYGGGHPSPFLPPILLPIIIPPFLPFPITPIMPIISLLPFLPEQWKAITIPESWQVGGDGWDGVDSIKRGMGFFEDIISGKSPPSTGGVALDALLNYMTDDDSDRYRAATTAVAQAGVEVGIASTGVGGAVLLTNAGVQVYGDVIEYTLRNWGGYYGEGWDAIYDQQAVSIGENFDRINLGNLTRDIGHIAADSYPIALGGVGIGLVSGQLKIKDIPGEWNKISQRQLQDYSDLWGHVSDLPGGIFDTGVDLIATGGMNYVASVDYLVSNLPVPGAYQDVVHQNSIKIGSYLESVL